MKTTREDTGNTVPGGLGPAVGRTSQDVWREELARKVKARNSQQPTGPAGIVTGPDGKMQTTTHEGGASKWFKARIYHP